MTGPGRYASPDGSFARSASGAAARSGALVAIACLIGLYLLSQGFDGGAPDAAIASTDDDSSESDEDDSTGNADQTDGTEDDQADGSTSEDETGGNSDTAIEDPPAAIVDPPEAVRVAVANGIGEPGLAGTTADALGTAGYVAVGVNAATRDHDLSMVYYLPDYEDEAKAVVVVLGGGSSVLDAAGADYLSLVLEADQEAVADFHIFVVLGADRILG